MFSAVTSRRPVAPDLGALHFAFPARRTLLGCEAPSAPPLLLCCSVPPSREAGADPELPGSGTTRAAGAAGWGASGFLQRCPRWK